MEPPPNSFTDPVKATIIVDGESREVVMDHPRKPERDAFAAGVAYGLSYPPPTNLKWEDAWDQYSKQK